MQYLSAKRTKWELKAWGLVDADTGYLWTLNLYLGKQPNVHFTHGLADHYTLYDFMCTWCDTQENCSHLCIMSAQHVAA